jgi:hypothetical protein
MQLHIFRSSDYGAPTLTNAVSMLINILTWALVTGQTPRACATTRAGAVATVTLAAHAHVTGDLVTHSGAAQAEYNVAARVTVLTPDTYTYPVAGAPATPATGAPVAGKAGPAWTKPYTGTNLAAFRTQGGNLRYLRIDESAAASPFLRLLGYESMTDINTGTGPFPTAAQSAGGLWFYKSADSSAHDWTIYATDRSVYMFNDYDATANSPNAQAFIFGDFVSYKAGDLYNTILIANAAAAYNSPSLPVLSAAVTAVTVGHYVARALSGSGGSINVGKITDAAKQAGTNMGATGLIYPNPADNGLYLSPCWITEAATPGAIRGVLPGLWSPLHNRPLLHGSAFAGSGDLAGKDFEARYLYTGAEAVIETSPTWW